MKNEDCLEYITDHLTTRELLEQLAEEAAELAQEALKTCRTLEDSNNPTQVSEDKVWEHLDDELVDVLNAYCALYGDFSAAANALMDCAGSPKWERWYERVKEAQKK
jgi:NTP pyrophosphatase (non-canonical NTP hydrolase)